MSTYVATLFYAALVLGLFWLDRDTKARTSTALWLPVIWFSLAGSRSASEWVLVSRPGATAEALLEGDPINRFAYTCLIASALVVLLLRWRKIVSLLQANGTIVLFLLYCLMSLMWADYPDISIKRWVKTVGDFAMVLIVVSESDPPIAIRRLLMRSGFLLIPVSVLLIKYYPDLARYYDRWTWVTSYSGATTNKNNLGAICLIFGLASAWQFLEVLSGRYQPRRSRRLIAHGVMLAMVIWVFSLARSMTSLACFILGITVLLLAEHRPLVRVSFVRMPSVAHALVAFLILIPSAVLFMGIGPVLSLIGKDPTLTDRTMVWGQLLAVAADPWLGAGFENFWLGPRLERVWSEYWWKPMQAHNGYLEIFLNLGFIGLALLGFVLLTGYHTAITRFRRNPSIGRIMLAYFVVGIVYNFTEAALFRMMTPVWIVLLLAVTKVPAPRDPGGRIARQMPPIVVTPAARRQAVAHALPGACGERAAGV